MTKPKLSILFGVMFFSFNSYAQNSPLFIWGSGLDGSLYQKTGIYSDTYYGLLFEAPKDVSNNRLDISFNWRGAGVSTPLFIQGSTLNVGVGTSSPQYKLHVAGSGFFQQRLTVQGDIPNDNNAAFWNNSNTGYGFYSQGGADGRYAFHFLNKEGNTIMYGKGDGRVGIGTAYPDAKLAVKGTVHAEEVKVDLQVPGPDYVFEPTYRLPSLTEIENYIKANKHLPEVPSAKEMETNGINLSEMNMLLLKKVEELTLYILAQNKTIEQQKAQADELQSRLIKIEKILNQLENK